MCSFSILSSLVNISNPTFLRDFASLGQARSQQHPQKVDLIESHPPRHKNPIFWCILWLKVNLWGGGEAGYGPALGLGW